MKIALAMTAWCRPEYLKPVLDSYREADLCGADRFFFIDGPIPGLAEPHNEAHRATVAQVAALCQEAGGEVHVRDRNFGVAHQIFESKELLFKERGYDVVISCVDDVVIAPYAIRAVLALRERMVKVRPDLRFTADVYNTLVASAEDKTARLGEIRVNGGMVLYAMDRHVWELISPVYAEYIRRFIQPRVDAGHPRPYRSRPVGQIRAWLEEVKGAPVGPTFATSQDGCVRVAMDKAGVQPWSTVVNHCVNIGLNGEHCNAGVFRKLQFDKMNLDLFDAEQVLAAIRAA